MQKPQQDTPSLPSTPLPLPPVPRLRLAQARTDCRWSQQDLAERIGTTHINVSRWERGLTKPGPYFRRKLCQLFGKTEEELDLTGIVLPLPSALTQQQAQQVAPPSPASHETQAAKEVPVYALPSLATALREAVYDPAIPLLPAMPLVGRDEEMSRLRQRLKAGGNVALTALNGLPGVGKTALAIALAHDQAIRAEFHDGVLWAGLGPQPNATGVLRRWGTLLGISSAEMTALSGSEAWALALRTAIGSRSMLLVIDDVWDIEHALTFKVGGANCAHLITTRFPGIATHIAFDGATTIRELDEEEGMALLRLLAPGVIEREGKKAHDLVQAVGGLPLALTLIGNYLRKQAYSSSSPRRVTAALERLSDAKQRLYLGEPHGAAEKHSSLSSETHLSLQTVFAVTDQLLSTPARLALFALSVFPPKPNSFSEEAALAVADCTVEELDMLSDFGLLESSSEARYTLHQTIVDYARLHLHANAAHERLIAYIVAYLEAHKKDYELLELEGTTILAALESAHKFQKHSELIRAVTAYAPFLLSRSLYAVAKQWLQRAHEVAVAQQDHRSIAGVLLSLGQIAQKQGDFVQAEIYLQDGLRLARQLGDFERMSALLTDLGGITWKRGDYAQAKMYLQDGLVLAQQMGHQERISGILEMLGSIASREGDYTRAETYYQESLKFIRQVGDREQISTILTNLGVAVGEQGNHVQAEAYFQEAFILARQIGYTDLMSSLLCNLGDAAGEQGHYARAEGYFQEGLLLARQVGRREWISMLLLNLGLATRKQGRSAQAEEYLQESLALARQINIPQITANILYEHGNLFLQQQQLGRAEKAFEEMLAVIPKGSQDLMALAQYGLARTFAAQGNIDEAQRLGEVSFTALEVMGHRATEEVKAWLNTLIV
jgi:tetratricopeptide (TPR) repeat protein/transcriptional regulator with XRE-family HTH domain